MVEDNFSLRFKVGAFSVLGLLLIGAITVFVNDRPYWWRACEPVVLTLEDATGLKTKSAVRSRGLHIGYLDSVRLSDTNVKLGICLTAPVEVMPETKAFVREQGFLGDRFVELKPVKYVGEKTGQPVNESRNFNRVRLFMNLASLWVNDAWSDQVREIKVQEDAKSVQEVVTQVNDLVKQVSGLAKGLNEAINPAEMKQLMKKLNLTLENASKTLSPEGNLTTTAQRTLAKLEDAIEQLRQILIRVNQGEGAVGMALSDKEFAEDIHKVVKSMDRFLNRVTATKLIVNLGAENHSVLGGSRGAFQLDIWPTPSAYYRLGVSVDPRGRLTRSTITTTVNGVTTSAESTVVEESGILLTGMLGKVFFDRYDFSAGVLHGDGAIGITLHLGPRYDVERFQLVNQVFSGTLTGGRNQIHVRSFAQAFPSRSPYLRTIYLRAGVESYRTVGGKIPYFLGLGLSFSDDDIKLLFAFI